MACAHNDAYHVRRAIGYTTLQVEKDSVWTFEQTQALELFNVFIPVRMTVIRLKSGGTTAHALQPRPDTRVRARTPAPASGGLTARACRCTGLWVHAPVAPTDECVRLVKELGPVEYIVLPTYAYEHKAFVGPFSRAFPKAQVRSGAAARHACSALMAHVAQRPAHCRTMQHATHRCG